MERIRRGDIWTVTLPSFPKPRPALIVSIDPINDLRPDVLVVPITTHPGPLRVAMPEDAAATGLREPSFAKCETVGPLQKSQLKVRIGGLRLRRGVQSRPGCGACWESRNPDAPEHHADLSTSDPCLRRECAACRSERSEPGLPMRASEAYRRREAPEAPTVTTTSFDVRLMPTSFSARTRT